MTVAFYEMMQLQANAEKEKMIQIKTRFVEWYFYFSAQFFIITKTWLNYPLLQRSGMAPEIGSIAHGIFF